MKYSECQLWMPDEVPRTKLVVPAGFTQVTLAASFIPNCSAIVLLVSIAISAASCKSNSLIAL